MAKRPSSKKSTKPGIHTPRPRSTGAGAQYGASALALPEGVELIDGVPHRKVIVAGRPRWVVVPL